MKKIRGFVNSNNVILTSISITIIGGLLRFFRLGRKSLWVDELGQLFVSSKSIPDLFENLSSHLSPPLDYLFLHLTLLLGDSEFLVRFNSALFGSLTIFVFFLLTRALFSNEIAFFSSILLAFSRFHIHYSQQARMYSLFCLLATLSFYLLWIYIQRKNKIHFIMMLVVNLAMLYTHYYGLFAIITQGLFLYIHILVEKDVNIKGKICQLLWTTCGFIIVGILYLPWLPILISQIPRFHQIVIGSTTLQSYYLKYLGSFSINWKFFRLASWSNWPSTQIQQTVISQFILDKYRAIFNSPWPKNSFPPFEIIFPALGIMGILSILMNWNKKKSYGFVILWLFLPLFLDTFNGAIKGTRFLIFILPPYLILISLGITGFKELLVTLWNERVGFLWVDFILTIIFMLVFSNLILYYYYNNNDNWMEVGKYLDKHSKSGDTILVLGGNSDYLNYYYTGFSKIIDADNMYKNDAFIKTMGDFNDFIDNGECNWIFISQHTNKLFGNISGSNYLENLESIRKILNKNFVIIEDIYTHSKHDLPGLYQSLNCKPE